MNLSGWVKNTSKGVTIEIEGSNETINIFIKRLQIENPPNSTIYNIHKIYISPKGKNNFKILQSNITQSPNTTILGDIALCADCLHEMNDPSNRRYNYPFITCTNCGPRYTIMTGLPYDRPKTTMQDFPLCAQCKAEYENPTDRRFHAQPLACPDCGPHIELWDNNGVILAEKEIAMQKTIAAIKDGKILAIKSLGGFHLVCNAQNEKTVQLLRTRKNRPKKPFAVMFSNINDTKKYCRVCEQEKKLLISSQAPIVLLQKKKRCNIAYSVSPDNPYIGSILPYTPLHYLLLQELSFPIIATSGNQTGEPICIDNKEALLQLKEIADLFLVHNRPIAHRADDSIVRIIAKEPMILRRARGYAPLPIITQHNNNNKESILAVGGHLKNTVALAIENKIISSPHIGDLNTPKAFEGHEDAINTLCKIYKTKPAYIAHDLHPDYQSTKNAQQITQQKYNNTTLYPIQHHYAHALSCMADNNLTGTAFAVVWDGAGYGTDGNIWGGEFLHITKDAYKRTGHFLQFPLPGGDLAAKEPRRAALGLLYKYEKNKAFERLKHLFSENEIELIKTALQNKINCPTTSSAGRMFDAVSSLLDLCKYNSFEGEAAMKLEFIADAKETGTYGFKIRKNGVVDWRPTIANILEEKHTEEKNAIISARWHNTLTTIIVKMAKNSKEQNILLTGGCFQNTLLLENAIKAITKEGLKPYWHKKIPTNDGGISIGQCIAVNKKL